MLGKDVERSRVRSDLWQIGLDRHTRMPPMRLLAPTNEPRRPTPHRGPRHGEANPYRLRGHIGLTRDRMRQHRLRPWRRVGTHPILPPISLPRPRRPRTHPADQTDQLCSTPVAPIPATPFPPRSQRHADEVSHVVPRRRPKLRLTGRPGQLGDASGPLDGQATRPDSCSARRPCVGQRRHPNSRPSLPDPFLALAYIRHGSKGVSARCLTPSPWFRTHRANRSRTLIGHFTPRLGLRRCRGCLTVSGSVGWRRPRVIIASMWSVFQR